jgi:hypothetical protein
VIIRADEGFYDHGLVEWLEARKAGFVSVARLTGPIKRRLAHLRYTSPSRGVEVAEFRYQPTRWQRSYRFVVIRRPQPEEPSEQLTLFKIGHYHYQVLLTNLTLQPLNLWRFYNDRAGIELLIRQLKGDYALGHIPTHHFFANQAYFQLLLLAYNLVNWFKRLCLPPEFQNYYDVFEVTAGIEVSFPSSAECLQFCPDEVRSGHDPQFKPVERDDGGRFNGRLVPAVREPKDGLIRRHDVKLHVVRSAIGRLAHPQMSLRKSRGCCEGAWRNAHTRRKRQLPRSRQRRPLRAPEKLRGR